MPHSLDTGADAAFRCQKSAYFKNQTKHVLTCATGGSVLFPLVSGLMLCSGQCQGFEAELEACFLGLGLRLGPGRCSQYE